MLAIPYKGGGPMAVDLVGGQVMLAFNTAPPIMPHIQSGRVRAIAVTMDKRVAVLPDVPTIAETGVPGYAMSTWYGAVVPVKTPREIVIRLSQEMLKALALPDVKERLAALGADMVGSSPGGDRGDVQGGSREVHEGRKSRAHPGGMIARREKGKVKREE